MASITQWVQQWYYSLLSLFYQQELNIVVLGFSNSGKTTVVNALMGTKFEKDTIPTIGVEHHYTVKENLVLKIFDVSGQERFHGTLWKQYLGSGVDLIIYVIDLSDPINLVKSKKKLVEIILETNEEHIPMVILGNKTDLLSDADFNAIGIADFKDAQNPVSAQFTSTGANNVTNEQTTAGLGDLDKFDRFQKFLGLEQESHDRFMLKRRITNPVLNQESASSGAEAAKRTTQKLVIEHNEDEFVELYRDLGIFLISCKEDESLQDAVNWIVGR